MAKKILLVDDDLPIAHIVKSVVMEWKYEFYYTNQGNQALVLAKKHKPDLILLDIKLPDLDGFSVQSQLWDDEATRNIPILLFTAHVKLTEPHGASPNVVGFILKPFDVNQLILKISSVIDR